MHLFNRRGTHHEKENNTLVCDDVTHLNSADDVIVYIADIQRYDRPRIKYIFPHFVI